MGQEGVVTQGILTEQATWRHTVALLVSILKKTLILYWSVCISVSRVRREETRSGKVDQGLTARLCLPELGWEILPWSTI